MTLDEWVALATAELGLDALPTGDQRLVLDLAREVAHNTVRPGAPVSAYLVGLAVGRGASLADATGALTELAHRHGANAASGGANAVGGDADAASGGANAAGGG